MGAWRLWRHKQEEEICPQEQAPSADHAAEMAVRLASADETLTFDVRLLVEAKSPHASSQSTLLDIAGEGVVRRAERISRQYTVTDAIRLRGALTTALHSWCVVPGTGVLSRGRCTSIDVDAEIVASVAARELAEKRSFAASWQDERRVQQAEQVRSRLLDPLRATAWWFVENQDKPERLEEVALAFDKARAILAPTAASDSPGQLIDNIVATSDPAAKCNLLRFLVRFCRDYQREELALLEQWLRHSEGGVEYDR
ncbi:hypothetical protein ACFPM7_22525 [Actinokineospora guangxiensis]|uniref:Uncharacterized protein n=1 Tax=Actinokineospora guangxiensis TaxID=1490288 RepID=A0ABW0ERK3_9PSEU